MSSRPSRIRSFLFLTAAVVCLIQAITGSDAFAQKAGDPVVARLEMRLTDGEKVIDVIEKGDLLTVTLVRRDDYVIVTHDGTTGAVAKVNAVMLAEATDIYTELIMENPKEGRYYTLRASAWWALKKTDKALADFDKAIENGYTQAHAYVSRGLFHAALGNFDQAITDYETAIEKDPEDVAPRINRAAVYMAKQDFDRAIEDYSYVLSVNPNAPSLLQQRAI
ncbi:MAG: tetratricopeptide repeat protein, partial [Planctomycetota bacterium]